MTVQQTTAPSGAKGTLRVPGESELPSAPSQVPENREIETAFERFAR